jgi:hypothetical protein
MAHVKLLQQVNAQVSMAEADAAWHAKCGYAARLIRTIKEEKVDLSDDQDGNDTRRKLGRFLDEACIRKRTRFSLGYLTPAGLEDQLRRERAVMHDVFQETAMQVSNQGCTTPSGAILPRLPPHRGAALTRRGSLSNSSRVSILKYLRRSSVVIFSRACMFPQQHGHLTVPNVFRNSCPREHALLQKVPESGIMTRSP